MIYVNSFLLTEWSINIWNSLPDYVRTQGGSVLYVFTKFEADSSIRSKVIRGSQNLEIRSRDPGHAYLGVVL